MCRFDILDEFSLSVLTAQGFGISFAAIAIGIGQYLQDGSREGCQLHPIPFFILLNPLMIFLLYHQKIAVASLFDAGFFKRRKNIFLCPLKSYRVLIPHSLGLNQEGKVVKILLPSGS